MHTASMRDDVLLGGKEHFSPTDVAASQAEALRVQTLADKAQALPPEPPTGSADTVSVLIRLPDGQRRTRRSGGIPAVADPH